MRRALSWARLWWAISILVCILATTLAQEEEVEPERYELTGEIEVLQADNFATGESHQHVLLKEWDPYSGLATHSLQFDKAQQRSTAVLRTGTFLRVLASPVNNFTGSVISANHIISAVHSYEIVEGEDLRAVKKRYLTDIGNEGAKLAALGLMAEAEEPRFGDANILRRLGVIITNFQDKVVSCSAESIRQMVWTATATSDFASVKQAFELNSFGKLSFTPNSATEVDVFGPFNIPLPFEGADRCRSDEWAMHAMYAANQTGVAVQNYRHIMFVLPSSETVQQKICKWNGLGNIGCGTQCRTWIGSCDSLGVYVHELGHNAGLRHAAMNWDLKGPTIEYGDPTAIMGNAWWSSNRAFYFNAAHRLMLGWLEEQFAVTAAGHGVWTITPFNLPPVVGYHQLVRVPAPHMANMRPMPYFVLSFAANTDMAHAHELLIHLVLSTAQPSEFVYTLRQVGDGWKDPSQNLFIRLLDIQPHLMRVETFFYCIPGETSVRTTFRGALVAPPVQNETFTAHILNQLAPSSDASVDLVSLAYTRSTGAVASFNFSLSVYNQDTPACTLVTYSYGSDVVLPESWTLECTPVGELVLMGQQICDVECHVQVPTSPQPKGPHFIVFTLTANSTIPASGRDRKVVLIVLDPHQCHASAPKIQITSSSSYPALQMRPFDTSTTLAFKSAIGEKFRIQAVLLSSDSLGCGAEFSRKITFSWKTPAGWVVSGGPVQAQDLRPQANTTVAFDIEIPTSATHDVTASLELEIDYQSGQQETFAFSITPAAACQFLAPTLTFSPELPFAETGGSKPLVMNPRMGGRVAMNISLALDSTLCPSSRFQVTLKSSDLRLQHAVVPGQSPRDYYPGDVAFTALTFTSSDLTVPRHDTDIDVVVEIEVTDVVNPSRPKVQRSFKITVLAQDCQLYLPHGTWGADCGGAIEIDSHPGDIKCVVRDLYLALSSRFLTTTLPQFRYWNPDTWPCAPGYYLGVYVPVNENAEQYIQNVTWYVQGEMMAPQNSSGNSFTFHVDLDALQEMVNETYTVTLEWAVMLWTKGENHVNTTTKSLTVGRCYRYEQTAQIDTNSEYIKVFSGDHAYFAVHVQAHNSEYCGSSYSVGLLPAQVTQLRMLGFGGMDPQVLPGTGTAHIHFQAPPSYSGLLNLTFLISDNNNASFVVNVTAVLEVSDECEIRPLQLTVVQGFVPASLLSGQPLNSHSMFNLTNMDSAGCGPHRFSVGASASGSSSSSLCYAISQANPTLYKVSVAVAPGAVDLAPGEWLLLNVTATTGAMVAPGSSLVASVSANGPSATHSARATTGLSIQCVAPRPIYDLIIDQQISSLGVVTALKLTWRGCDRAGECCCPCTYDIHKDGVKIANTRYLNFTYTPTIAQIGTSVAFSVHVIDSKGLRSSENTCGIEEAVTVKSSNLDYLVVLMVILGVIALPALIVLMEKLRTKNILLSKYVDEDD